MIRPAIYDDDGELIVAEIAAVSACYATGLIPQRPAAPAMLCTSENYQCISPNFIGCCLCEDLLDIMVKGYNGSRHCQDVALPCYASYSLAQQLQVLSGAPRRPGAGPLAASAVCVLCEAEADGTRGRTLTHIQHR